MPTNLIRHNGKKINAKYNVAVITLFGMNKSFEPTIIDRPNVIDAKIGVTIAPIIPHFHLEDFLVPLSAGWSCMGFSIRFALFPRRVKTLIFSRLHFLLQIPLGK